MILAIKTAGDPTEIYLLNDSGEIVRQKVWNAERRLAHDLLGEIEELLTTCHPELVSGSTEYNVDSEHPEKSEIFHGFQNDKWGILSDIIVFRGPGSFTGLRIGITTANTIAYARNVPIVDTTGENWRENGLEKLKQNENDQIVMPEYGAEPNITKPKK